MVQISSQPLPQRVGAHFEYGCLTPIPLGLKLLNVSECQIPWQTLRLTSLLHKDRERQILLICSVQVSFALFIPLSAAMPRQPIASGKGAHEIYLILHQAVYHKTGL